MGGLWRLWLEKGQGAAPVPAIAEGSVAFGFADKLAQMPGNANNLNENSAWQFRTSADETSRAAVLD